ncbi:3-hydroxyacyl-CoA dehydrogenase family protein [Brevibacillus laterosporus]|nr:3-hydroxyacyl-CoA dehydrogenase family protein [Brevibacillus laterosporus]TPG68381.1 3-hydroxyacyl-CoA dehydrogenase family protein [Brevibacillus laterosporus]
MVKRVAVIGAGVMGHGIAQAYAGAGIQVNLYDPDEQMLQKAKNMLETSMSLFIQEGVWDEEHKENTWANLRVTTNLSEALNSVELVTEAIPEILELKWKLFADIEAIVDEDIIIASNTSTIPLSQLAARVQHPERMVITHFFNPAQIVPLVEIVKHERTTDHAISTVMEVMTRIGKEPILLQKEVPGFIANRLQAALIREAFHLIEEGVADARAIDTAVTAGPGFRWSKIGPMQTVDFGGLDTWMRVMQNLAPVLSKEEKTPGIIRQHVEAGELGVKTGKGLFDYTDEEVLRETHKRDVHFLRLLALQQEQL